MDKGRGKVYCDNCGIPCTVYWMCDEGEPSETFCPECFKKHPCGQGKHGEECPTQVIDATDTPGYTLYGYWDVFNACLHKSKAVADKCAEGGNAIIPLYRKDLES